MNDKEFLEALKELNATIKQINSDLKTILEWR